MTELQRRLVFISLGDRRPPGGSEILSRMKYEQFLN